ncbi:ABC-2 type transport system ATP-binding protein [Dethiosulfatibacter aminovorans DSM 17477]|uniref:ABC-2 type transport system ATP-binding protein n=1 Tax=Dethiosulfatibacter aminovorans DSM 17477 TaxID=1121476 RepID=A0A1M6ASB4_9FIRM|nr:ABC transporter ATP-binding protein [Dethiosulfatibacter aminovorans]SHI39317.1 ABC-2 type transport system ATP-binding protein [Dethiosulfatibacter aminovorans DSM 17477]
MKDILELEGISKVIKGRTILDDISFAVKRGQIYGFLGPNGAGKTMTLRMIAGLIRPSKGRISICGHSVAKSFVKAMENVGCIIEYPEFYEFMSGYDNLMMLRAMEPIIEKSHVRDTIELVGMSHRINDRVSSYSLGMKQRLGIAQALMKKPSLLILDEPTNGLDPAGIKEFRELLKSLVSNSDISILLSSHLLSEVQMICDEVAIIMHGRIIRTSKVSDLTMGRKVIWQVDDVQRAVGLLRNEFDIISYVDDDNAINAFVDDDLTEINEALVNSGIGLRTVFRTKRTLEELFIELTGGETIG